MKLDRREGLAASTAIIKALRYSSAIGSERRLGLGAFSAGFSRSIAAQAASRSSSRVAFGRGRCDARERPGIMLARVAIQA